MTIFQRHSLATSLIGGVLFGLAGLVFGGGWKPPTGIALVILVGVVFAVSMYRGLRRQRPPG